VTPRIPDEGIPLASRHRVDVPRSKLHRGSFRKAGQRRHIRGAARDRLQRYRRLTFSEARASLEAAHTPRRPSPGLTLGKGNPEARPPNADGQAPMQHLVDGAETPRWNPGGEPILQEVKRRRLTVGRLTVLCGPVLVRFVEQVTAWFVEGAYAARRALIPAGLPRNLNGKPIRVADAKAEAGTPGAPRLLAQPSRARSKDITGRVLKGGHRQRWLKDVCDA
jgi:hypothetical protein